MIPKEPTVYRNFITEDERVVLKEHALDLLNDGVLQVNTVTPGNYRNYKCFYKIEELNPLHQKVYHRIVEVLNLTNPMIDPNLGIIISVIKPGGFIHDHIDPYVGKFSNFSNKRNCRFNIMIERDSDTSYDPHIENESLAINKCDAWYFNAAEMRHNTPIIKGNENRIVYQFGFMIDAN